MYIVSWRRTPPLATVSEAALKDYFGMLSDLDKVILHAPSLLAERRRRVQMITRTAEVANASLCAKWANRSSSPLVIVQPCEMQMCRPSGHDSRALSIRERRKADGFDGASRLVEDVLTDQILS